MFRNSTSLVFRDSGCVFSSANDDFSYERVSLTAYIEIR